MTTDFTLSKIHDLGSYFSISVAEVDLLALSSIPLKALAGQDTDSALVFTLGTHTDEDRSRWRNWARYAETLASAWTFAIRSSSGIEVADDNIQEVLQHAADRLDTIVPTISVQVQQTFLTEIQAIKTTYDGWADPCWST